MGLVNKRGIFLLSGTIAAGIYGSMAMAADIDAKTSLPAVSGPNGKIELSGGYVDLEALDGDAAGRIAASLSFPVGDMFGIQADLGAVRQLDETVWGGNLHAFTRDPDSYLFGVMGGFADFDNANLWYVGPEAEFYIDNLSIELTGGYMNVNPSSGKALDKAFVIGDLAYYATDNLRLSIGGRSIGGFETAAVGLEWHLADQGLPASFTLDGRFGEDHFASVMAGFSVYFGGEEKSLIRRHREDDPRNRTLDIFGFHRDSPAVPPPYGEPPPPPPEGT